MNESYGPVRRAITWAREAWRPNTERLSEARERLSTVTKQIASTPENDATKGRDAIARELSWIMSTINGVGRARPSEADKAAAQELSKNFTAAVTEANKKGMGFYSQDVSEEKFFPPRPKGLG